MSSNGELIILPPLKAVRDATGGLVLTQKYIDGMVQYARDWPGPVTSLVQISQTESTDMDHTTFRSEDPRISVELRPESSTDLADRLARAAVVLSFLSPDEAALPTLCRAIDVPLVFFAEYSPRTERQIVDAETTNPVLRWRRKLWIRRATGIRIAMLKHAAGLQCSGTPVYNAYKQCHSNSLLFFDNRVRQADILSVAEMQKKAEGIAANRPLRLVFGGRLIEMKGVMELPKLAAELVRQGTPFTVDIYGSGPLENKLRKAIGTAGLEKQIRLKGARDFSTGWIPAVKDETDLFICPHLQGDPSSTYPEVMSCGTAIAGYDNEAFRGIVETSGSGWLVPMRDHITLANTVTRLHHDRAELIAAAYKAREFAVEHSFEATFARRTAHLREAARRSADQT